MFDSTTNWKGRLLRFIVYIAIGFHCAFLYRYLKG
jgi:hypothetical protein